MKAKGLSRRPTLSAPSPETSMDSRKRNFRKQAFGLFSPKAGQGANGPNSLCMMGETLEALRKLAEEEMAHAGNPILSRAETGKSPPNLPFKSLEPKEDQFGIAFDSKGNPRVMASYSMRLERNEPLWRGGPARAGRRHAVLMAHAWKEEGGRSAQRDCGQMRFERKAAEGQDCR